jgi:5'-nucleotidase (lipoprotein e(P4) family)
MRIRTLALFVFVAIATVTKAQPCRPGDDHATATLWASTAAERDAASWQAYALATRAMEDAAAAEKRKPRRKRLPLAAILDLDETVLDNMGFQHRMAAGGLTYTKDGWKAWVNKGDPGALPGAKGFLEAAADAGVTPFFITNREWSSLEGENEIGETLKDLERLGLPVLREDEWAGEDNVLFSKEHPEWGSDKVSRRKWVEERYRVVTVIGDDLNDFAPAKNIAAAVRKALVKENASKWGREWFILPNPIYGSWSDTLLAETLREPGEELTAAMGRLRGLSPCDEIEVREKALRQAIEASATAASSTAD